MNKALFQTMASLALLLSWSARSQTAIEFDATSGNITPPFVVTNGYLCQPVQTEAAEGGRAVFRFTITNPGPYVIQARVDAPASQTNSFYVNIDSEPKDSTMLWEIPNTTGLTPRVVSWRGAGSASYNAFARKVFSLSTGNHELIIRGNTPNTKLAHVSVQRVPAPPANLRILASP